MARPLATLLGLLACMLLAWSVAQDLPLDEVRIGDVGYGVTAGPDGLARFDVEVLGVQRPDGPTFPTILVRTSGAFLESVGGVAAGMSGSPVYLERDGVPRLAGALAYGFPDTDHTLALLTPIEAMRSLTKPQPPRVELDVGTAVALQAPLLVSGLSIRAHTHLAPLVEAAGQTLLPLQVGGTADVLQDPTTLQPGDAIGVALARGDVTIAAVGTLTDVAGDELLLLGHPLLGRGASALAVVPANVTAIVPSRRIPYKLANVGRTALATVHRDAAAGLAATRAVSPSDVPLRVTIEGPMGSETVDVQVTRDPDLLPSVVATVVHTAIDDVRDAIRGGSATVAWRIGFENERDITLQEDRSSNVDLATAAARLAGAPIAVLTRNPFQDPRLASIDVHVRTFDAPREVELVEVALETPTVTPGGTVQAFIRLQPYRAEAEVRTLSIKVPDDVKEGPLRLTLRGATIPDPERENLVLDEDRDPLEQAISDLPPIVSWGELLAALQNRPKARDLLVEAPGEDRPRRLARLDLGGDDGAIVTGVQHVTVTVVASETPSASDTDTTTDAEVNTP